MKENLLSIIIPTKNENETFRRLLKKLKAQTLSSFEIIVSDSSENNIVKNICEKNKIRLTDGGLPGKARNNGALIAKNPNLLFLDADIIISDDFIEKLLEQLCKLDFDAASFKFKAESKNILLKLLHEITSNYFWLTTKLGYAHGIGGAFFVKKKTHDEIGGFDETILIAEDVDYSKRIAKKFKYKFLKNPLVKLDTRRFKKEGVLKLIFKILFFEIHRIFLGEIRNDKIKYF